MLFDESLSLEKLFDQRKEIFWSSLQKAASSAFSDNSLKKIVQNKNSDNQLFDQISQTIKKILSDDREKYIENILLRFNAIEKCIGNDLLGEIEGAGITMLEITKLAVEDQNVNKKNDNKKNIFDKLKKQLLQMQMKYFDDDNLGNKTSNQIIKMKVSQLKDPLDQLASTFNGFQLEMKQYFKRARMQLKLSSDKFFPQDQTIIDDSTQSIKEENEMLKNLIKIQNNTSNLSEEEKEVNFLRQTLKDYQVKIDKLTEENGNSKRSLRQTVNELNMIKSLIMENVDTSIHDDNTNDDIFSRIYLMKMENQNNQSEIIRIKAINERLFKENNQYKTQILQSEGNPRLLNINDQAGSSSSKELHELEVENLQMKNVNSQLLDASKQLQNQNKEVVEQLSALKEENSELKFKINAISSSKSDLEKLNESLQRQVSELSLLNDSSRADSLVFKEKAAQEVQKVKQENQELYKELNKMNNKLGNIKSESKAVQEEISKKELSNSKLINEINELRMKVLSQESKAKSFENDKNMIAVELYTIQTRIAQLENENISLKAENNQLKTLHEESVNNYLHLKETANSLSQLNSKLNSQLNSQNTNMQSMNETSKFSEQMAESYKDQLRKQQQDLSESLLTISKLKQENIMLKTSQNGFNYQEMQESLERVNNERNELRNTVEQLRSDINKLEISINEKEQKILSQKSKYTTQCSKLKQRLVESQQKLEAIKTASGFVGSKDEKLLTYMSKSSTLQQSLLETESQLAKAGKERSKLMHALRKSNKKVEMLKREIDEHSLKNEKLQSQNDELREIKNRVSAISNSNTFFDSQIIGDDVHNISETISIYKKENKKLASAVSDLTKFQKMVCEMTQTTNMKEAEFSLKSIIKSKKEFQSELNKIREVLLIDNSVNIVSNLKNQIKKISVLTQIKNLLKSSNTPNNNTNELSDDDVFRVILMMKAKAENNESQIVQEYNKNSVVLHKLSVILQNEQNGRDINKLPLAVQSLQAQIDEDRILFRQIRQLIQVNDNDEIVSTIQSIVLKSNEYVEQIEKIGRIINCAAIQEVPQRVYELQLKNSIINEIKNMLKITKDEEIISVIQRNIAFIEQVKENYERNNSNELGNSNVKTVNNTPNNSRMLDTSFGNGNALNQIENLDDSIRARTIHENESILSQLCVVLKVDHKSDLVQKSQRIQNYLSQAYHILNVETLEDFIAAVKRVSVVRNQNEELNKKLNEKEQNDFKMEQMLKSLESQMTEISNIADQKRIQTEASQDEIISLQSTLKSSSHKVESLHSRIEKKNATISVLKDSLMSLQSENEKITNKNNQLELSLSDLQTRVKKVESDLQVESIEKIIDVVNELKSKLSLLVKLPIKDEDELRRLDEFKACFKEISSVLISTDVKNFPREIGELRSQNEELIKMKNHLSYSLTLKLNESLTSKVDEVLRNANESQAIISKLCSILNVPSREEVTPAVDTLLRQNKETENQCKILQTLVSVNSNQALVKSIKSMRQKIVNVVDRLNLHDESEIENLNVVIKQCQVNSLESLSQKINELNDISQKYNELLKLLKIKSEADIPLLDKKLALLSKIINTLEIIKINASPHNPPDALNSNLDENQIIGMIKELLNLKKELEQLFKTPDIIKTVEAHMRFETDLCNKYGLDNPLDINQLEIISNKTSEILHQQNEICNILKIEQPNQIKVRINGLMHMSKTIKKVAKLLNVNDTNQVIESITQLQQDIKAARKTFTLLNAYDDTQVKAQIQRFLKTEKKTCKILGLTDSSAINEKVLELVKSKEMLTQLFKANDIYSTTQNMFNTFDSICKTMKLDILLSNSIEQNSITSNLQIINENVTKLNTNYIALTSFFIKIFGVLLGQEAPLQFPLSSEFEDKMISQITKIKQTGDSCQTIFSKANSVGYNGESVSEALDTLLENTKQQEYENFKKEIERITESAQIEIVSSQKSFEDQKLKFKKAIGQFKNKISDLIDINAELSNKLKKSQRKKQILTNAIKKEKELNQSLLSIIQENTQNQHSRQINQLFNPNLHGQPLNGQSFIPSSSPIIQNIPLQQPILHDPQQSQFSLAQTPHTTDDDQSNTTNKSRHTSRKKPKPKEEDPSNTTNKSKSIPQEETKSEEESDIINRSKPISPRKSESSSNKTNKIKPAPQKELELESEEEENSDIINISKPISPRKSESLSNKVTRTNPIPHKESSTNKSKPTPKEDPSSNKSKKK